MTEKAELALNVLGCPDAELSLLFAEDRAMREINRDYRGIDAPTNVLSFAMHEGDFGDLHPEILGDVVISIETALREAKEWAMSPDIRITQLLVHGILHLLGYDHEQGPEAEREMETKSTELVRIIEKDKKLHGWFSQEITPQDESFPSERD